MSPSIPPVTNRGHSRAKEHNNQHQEPAFTHNSFILQLYDVSTALCCTLTKQTHKCRYKYTHHMKNPLSLISVSAVCSPFCEWEVSVCGAGATHTAHRHTHKHKSLSHPQSTSLQSAGTVSV